jgi:aerobic-type carbon monoxide dehydrogenase small subunit (CoxS/CutS family)
LSISLEIATLGAVQSGFPWTSGAGGSSMAATKLHVNGTSHALDLDPDRSLLFVLRDELGLTGCKYGCGEGECGACTVLLDGRAVRSCITTVGECADKQLMTIEGLEQNGQLHPLQTALMACDALQCGYCTPGMVMSGVALLKSKPKPTDEEIFHAMNGNICRCGTYHRIVQAIHQAVEAEKGAPDENRCKRPS